MREDMGLTMQEMADATGRSLAEYQAQESGAEELSFTFLYKCAANLGVDPIELLTGETPHLTGYTLTRADEGLAVKRRERALSTCTRPRIIATSFASRSSSPPITALSCRTSPSTCRITAGQELDYILEGRMRFQYEEHTEELGPGDMLLYDSGRGHGMIAIDGAPCKFLAVVLKAKEDII